MKCNYYNLSYIYLKQFFKLINIIKLLKIIQIKCKVILNPNPYMGSTNTTLTLTHNIKIIQKYTQIMQKYNNYTYITLYFIDYII